MSPGSTPTEVDDFALQARPLLVASGAPEGAAVDPWHSQTSLGNNDDPISSAATARKPDLAGAISSDLASSLYQTSSPLENVMAEALADNAGTSEFSDPSAPPFMLTRSEDDTGTINSERLDSYVSDGNTAVDPAPRIEPAIRSRPNYAAPLPAVLHKPGFLRRILKRFGL